LWIGFLFDLCGSAVRIAFGKRINSCLSQALQVAENTLKGGDPMTERIKLTALSRSSG
jgi:hypothetical protein